MSTAEAPKRPLVGTLLSSLAAAAGVGSAELEGKIRPPPKPDMGDYAFPCFDLAKERGLSPPQLAAELAAKVNLDAGLLKLFEPAEASGPFLNFRARPGFICA